MKGCGTVSPFELTIRAAFMRDRLEMKGVARPSVPVLNKAGSLARSERS